MKINLDKRIDGIWWNNYLEKKKQIFFIENNNVKNVSAIFINFL